jgi:hypothetical protein
VLHATQESANEFRDQIPLQFQASLAIVEDVVWKECTTVHDWEIDVKIGNWVLDMGNSMARETKYLKNVELC